MRPRQPEAESIDLPPYHIDLVNRVVKMDNVAMEMTDKEYDLTLFLFRNLGRLMSRGHISESVWGRSADIQSRTVDTHVSRVRKKLDFGPERGLRLTPIYNFGYRLEKVTL
jgi:DNA-binding response OmpR family regulator